MPTRRDKSQPFSKKDVSDTYDSLSADKKNRLSAVLEELAAPPEVPLTSVELTTFYEALDVDSQMRISNMVERLDRRANRGG